MKLKDLRPGSIGIVIDSNSGFEGPIELVTGDAHHTFCYHGDGKITEAHVGARIELLSIDKYLDDNKYVILVLEPRNDKFSDSQIKGVVKRWREDIGKKYEIKSIMAQVLPFMRNFTNDKRRICSEHTAYGYKGLHKFLGTDYSRVTPHDILKDAQLYNYDKFKPIRLTDLTVNKRRKN